MTGNTSTAAQGHGCSAAEQNPAVIVDHWLAKFNAAVGGDLAAMQALFVEDSHWRNILGFGWNFATISGAQALSRALLEQASEASVTALSVHPSRVPAASGVRAGEDVIEAALAFESRRGRGIGVVRLRTDDNSSYRAWSLMTAMDEMHNLPARPGDGGQHDPDQLPPGNPHMKPVREGPNWLELRDAQRAFADRDPQVLVVGGGHNGLAAAAELGQIGLDTLVIDSYERIGDNWRNRYHSLCLHNKTPVNHLPYLPFPPTFPRYIPKDQVANWLEFYAETLELNVWPRTRFLGATRTADGKAWQARVLVDGQDRTIVCPHIVMATSTSGTPKIPEIPTLDQFDGEVVHAAAYSESSRWRDRPVTVFGCGSSAHDICQDLHSHGARVTMVQRGPTTIVNLEPSAQLYDQIYYTDGPPLADRDLVNSSVPLALLKKAHKLLTDKVKKIDEPILTALRKVGMKLDFGEDDTGWSLKYRTRGGGYYFNVGCSELIASGDIRLMQFEEIDRFDANGMQLRNGTMHHADLLVMATGYHNQDVVVREWFGDQVADRVGQIWGFDDTTQELRNMWTRTGQQGLWFTAGAFSQARIFSKYLAMQIRAEVPW